MNVFVLLSAVGLLANFVTARPDVSLGYRYNPGYSSAASNVLQAPTSSFNSAASSSSYANAAPGIGQTGTAGFVPSTQSIAFGGGGLNTKVIPSSSTNVNYQQSEQSYNSYQQSYQQNYQAQAPIVTKHFYLHTAPVDQDDQQMVRYINIGQPRKDYRVVFIDTPSSSSSKAKIIANVAPTEEKTAIYVLSKKSNALDIQTEVNTPAPVQHKPEVFFIKYRTPEEAVHAEHTIQAQYDQLGGSSDFSNEGAIPVSSVIGSLGGSHGDSGAGNQYAADQPQGNSISGANTKQTYLPPSRRIK